MYRYKIKYFVYEIILYYIILKMVVLFCQQCNNCTYTHILYNYRCLYLRFKFCIYVFVLLELFFYGFNKMNNYFINLKISLSVSTLNLSLSFISRYKNETMLEFYIPNNYILSAGLEFITNKYISVFMFLYTRWCHF